MNNEQYYQNYNSLEQQRWMVADRPRTDAFAEAIAEIVQPGDVVIDVGAGTGVLSLLAAKAGARRVIGIERSGMAHHAQKLIERNGYADRIEIVHGNAHDIQLDKKADVIISEWLGHMAFVESMFNSVIRVRDKWLKPGGKMIPAAVDVLLAPMDNGILYNDHGPGFWMKKNIHGIDFSNLESQELEMGHANQVTLPKEFLLAPGKVLHSIDTHTARTGDEANKGTVDFKILRDGMMNGFAGWFNSPLSPAVTLDTSSFCPDTHWQQTYFPFHPIKVEAGQTIKLDYQMAESFDGSRLMEMVLHLDGKEIRYIVD